MKTQLLSVICCAFLLTACSDDKDSDSTLQKAVNTATDKIDSGKESVSYKVDAAKEKTEAAIAETKAKTEAAIADTKEKLADAKDEAQAQLETAKDIIGDGTVTKDMIEDKKDELRYKLGQ